MFFTYHHLENDYDDKAIFIFFPMLCGTKSRVSSWKFPYLLCSYFKLPERLLICKLRVTRSLSYFLHSFFILLGLVYYEQLVNISQYLSKTHYLLHKFYDTCIGRLYITFFWFGNLWLRVEQLLLRSKSLQQH